MAGNGTGEAARTTVSKNQLVLLWFAHMDRIDVRLSFGRACLQSQFVELVRFGDNCRVGSVLGGDGSLFETLQDGFL